MAQRNYAPPTGFTEEVPMEPPPVQDLPVADPAAAPPAADPNAPPEGFQPVQISEADIAKNLQGLFNKGTPLADINAYSAQFGRQWRKEDQEVLANYEKWRLANPGKKPNFQVVPGEPGRDPNLPETSSGGAAARGFADGLFFDGADEATAGIDAAGRYLGARLGINDDDANMDLSDIYRRNWDHEQDLRKADWEDHPWERGIGKGVGIGTTLLIPGGGLARGAQGANALGRGALAARGAAWGAGYGGLSGTMSGSPDDRFGGTLPGAAGGAVLGGTFTTLAPTIGRVATAIGEKIGIMPGARNAMSGIDAMLRRVPTMDPRAMATRAAEMRGDRLEPTIVDLAGEQGRGVVRAAASRMTPARDRAQEFADVRAIDAQDRVAAQARRVMTGSDPRTADEAVTAVREVRDATADAAFSAVRAEPVPLSPTTLATLGTEEGQAAIRMAMRSEDIAGKDALKALAAYVKGPKEAAIPAELAGLSPSAQAAAMAQLGIKAPEPPPFTAGMADKLRKAFSDAAGRAATSGEARRASVLRQFGNEIRDDAASAAPGYAKALEDFGTASRTMDAAKTGGEFMRSGPPGTFADKVAPVDAVGAVPGAPSARTMARIGARDAVETAAGESPRAALTVANKLGVSANQAERSAAVLGDTDAANLARAMRGEVEIVRNARDIAPKTGSQTQLRGQDAEAVGEVVNFLGNAAGGKLGMLRQIGQMAQKAGLRDVDAERLVSMAIDPRQTDAVINYMIQRGASRPVAEAMLRSTQRLLGYGSGETQENTSRATPRLLPPPVQ